DTGGAHNDGVVAPGQRLRDRQNYRVAAGQIVVSLDVLNRFGNRRHAGLPGVLVTAIMRNRQCPARRSGLKWNSCRCCYRGALDGAASPKGIAPGCRMVAALASSNDRAPIWPRDARNSSV